MKTAEQASAIITVILHRIAADYGVTIEGLDYQLLFADLTRQLAAAHDGKVVLLIDEYDKPITDNLTKRL